MPLRRRGIYHYVQMWYGQVGKFGNKVFNYIAAVMYDREDKILNYFVYHAMNASTQSPNAKTKQFRV